MSFQHLPVSKFIKRFLLHQRVTGDLDQYHADGRMLWREWPLSSMVTKNREE